MSGAVSQRSPRAPVCIYVLWHSDCVDGPRLANTLFEWFYAPATDLLAGALGVPVYFRSMQGNNGRPLEIRFEDADLNFIVPLVDDHMIADPAWREYLADIAHEAERGRARRSTGGTRRSDRDPASDPSVQDSLHLEPAESVLYPVALSPNAYLLDALHRLNFVHLDREGESRSGIERLSRRERRLRRTITEACSRDLHARLRQQGIGARGGLAAETSMGTPPLTVFISHAKQDGGPDAARLRDLVLGYSQLNAFFDENDIPFGSEFAPVLEEALGGEETVGMLSVISDTYAERPWCRRELRQARTPRRDHGASESKTSQCWYTLPVVAVSTLQGRSRGMPDLGNVPTVRWDARNGDAAEHGNDAIDTLILESLRLAYRRLFLRSLNRHLGLREGDVAISWDPDSHTLGQLRGQLASDGEGPPRRLIYPGYGLAQDDRVACQRAVGCETLVTYGEAMNQHEDSRLGETAKGVAGSPLVALSFGSFGDDSDLTLLGYHVHHVHLAVLQVARALLDAGCSIGYGGIFHHEDSFLRQLLLLVSRFESEANRLGLEDQGKRHPSSRFAPLVSYQAWPHHRAIDTQTIASNHRLCRFIKVDPEEFYKVDAAGLSGEAMRARADDDLVAAAFLQAQALSRMRRVMIEGVADTVDGITCTDGEVPVAHGRVVFGGKSSRTSGIMPGIAEEVLVSLRALEPGTPICHAGPLLIVGEFGGCAKVIADYLTGASGNSENLPASLDLATVRNNDAAFQRVESGFLAYHPLASAYLENEWSDLAVRLQTLRRRVREEGLVHELKEKEAPVAGLTIEISKGGHLIVHPPSVRRLVARLLATLSGRSTS